jgi:hypothetical protein
MAMRSSLTFFPGRKVVAEFHGELAAAGGQNAQAADVSENGAERGFGFEVSSTEFAIGTETKSLKIFLRLE